MKKIINLRFQLIAKRKSLVNRKKEDLINHIQQRLITIILKMNICENDKYIPFILSILEKQLRLSN